MTLKSQCYFDILGSVSPARLATTHATPHPGTPDSSRRWMSATNPFLLIDTVNTLKRTREYGVPVNQLSLIYLVKEHWFAKNQKPSPASIPLDTSRGRVIASDFSLLKHLNVGSKLSFSPRRGVGEPRYDAVITRQFGGSGWI